MTMAVQQHARSGRHERQIELSRVRLAGQEFLEQERAIGDPARRIALDHRRNFVAETEQATWLQADHR